MKTAVGIWVSVVTLSLGLQRLSTAQTPPPRELIETFQLQPNFFMIAGGGANVAVQVGPDGLVIVDTGSRESAAAILRAIRKISPKPIRYLINTSADPDHVGGNAMLAEAGESFIQNSSGTTLGDTMVNAINNGGGAAIVASEEVLNRMNEAAGSAAYPINALPTETFTRAFKHLYLNREAIEVLRQPAAHTNGDSVVFFRKSDVIVAGDILDIDHFPFIDVAHGGSMQGEITALNRLIDIAISPIPLTFQEGGTQVIPGRGRLCDQSELVEYRDMLTIIRDRIQDKINSNASLAAIKAANPTEGFRPRYGSESGARTTDNFVEAVYQSLMKDKR